MPENARLSGCLGQIDLEFVEREATPQLLMKLSIQLHLAELSLSNTVSILEIFGVERARSTVLVFADLREKHDVDDAVFLVDGAPTLKDACQRHGLRFQYEKHGNRNAVERVIREIKTTNLLVLKLFQQRRSRHRR